MNNMQKLLLSLKEEQKEFLKEIEYKENDVADLESKLGLFIQLKGLREDSELNYKGEIALSILDEIGNL